MEKITKSSSKRHWGNSLLLLLLMVAWFPGFSQNIGINTTGASPNPAAGLDVDFPDKGLLIPRVALSGSDNIAPLAAHVAGMVVYNTATAGDVTPGFYLDNGTKWIIPTFSGTAAGDLQYWNGTAWVVLSAGLPGQYLQINGSGLPVWTGAALASLTTAAVSSITATTAISGGDITSDGGSAITYFGVCWNTTPNPTTALSTKTMSVAGVTGPYISNLTGLTTGTTYYVRAFATNLAGTAYGNEISFTTP